MSFLLDALDKAESDRDRTKLNELKTPVQKKRRLLRRILQLQLLVALVLASFALGYYARPYIEGERPAALTEQPVARKSSEATQQSEGASLVERESYAVQSRAAANQNQAFNVKLSAISYSDIPASRFAMINGFVMYEGDVLASGERLTKIQRSSIVMTNKGTEKRIALNSSGQ